MCLHFTLNLKVTKWENDRPLKSAYIRDHICTEQHYETCACVFSYVQLYCLCSVYTKLIFMMSEMKNFCIHVFTK